MAGIIQARWCRAAPARSLSSLVRPRSAAPVLRRASSDRLTGRHELSGFFGLVGLVGLVGHPRTYATFPGQSKDAPLLDPDEWSLLRHLLSNPSEETKTSPTEVSSDQLINPVPMPLRHQATWDVSELARSFKDPAAKFAYLGRLAEAARRAQELDTMSTAVLTQLPAPVFSELLRSLDPLDAFSKELDPTDGMPVGAGMAQLTPLGDEFDIWGVRKRYVVLLDRAFSAAKLRFDAGQALQLADYKMLLRCAAAAADVATMSAVWDLMEQTGLRELDPDAYAELAKARFFTEPLYAQHDLARMRVRPIDMHMRKLWLLGRKQRHYLRIRGHNQALRRRHYFGHNRLSTERAEHPSRLLRRHHPVYAVMRAATRLGYILDERTLCAFMVANARAASLRPIEDRILDKYWGIRVTRGRGREAHVEIQKVKYAPDSPLRPTGKLLEAIVHSYCANSEFSVALTVLDHVSSCYAIPISDKVWFTLFEWANVLLSKPVRTEWRVLHRQFRGNKQIARNALQMVWDTMTAEPYNVRPGYRQYELLAMDLISRGSMTRAIDVLLVLEPMYKDLVAELESAFSKHAVSTALGVNVAASARAWERARAQKYAALHRLQVLCAKLLKRATRKGPAVDAHLTLRGIPQFLEAFRDVLPSHITYSIATGTVQIHRVGDVHRLEQHMAQFTQLPLTTGDVRINDVTNPKAKVIEEMRLRPGPHVSLRGFLDNDHLSWPEVQREFY